MNKLLVISIILLMSCAAFCAEIEISSLVDLQLIIDDGPDWSVNTYIQTANIDASPTQVSTYGTASDTSGVGDIGNASGEGFLPIGDTVNRFNTDYDGQGFLVTGLFINRPTVGDGVGFFGFTTTVLISNIALLDVDITGQSNVGGLISRPGGTQISKVKVTGKVTATSFICGGMLGRTDNGTIVSNCYTNVNAGSSIIIGGFVGDISSLGSIFNNCYASGAINGSGTLAGFCGRNDNGGVFNDCFYDSTTSGQSDTGKGEPKTTAEMQTQATFDPPWDFEDIWFMDGYPDLLAFKPTTGGNSIFGSKVSIFGSLSGIVNPVSSKFGPRKSIIGGN